MAWRLRDGPPDAAFGLRLYAAGRARELAATGWPAAVQQAFLAQQHAAREAHYRRVHPQAEDRVIERDAQAVGRLLLARDAQLPLALQLLITPGTAAHPDTPSHKLFANGFLLDAAPIACTSTSPSSRKIPAMAPATWAGALSFDTLTHFVIYYLLSLNVFIYNIHFIFLL